MNRMIRGPFGGMYESDFYKALNTNQPIRCTKEEINIREDTFLWYDIEKQYESFLQSIQQKEEPPPPQIPLHIHLIWISSGEGHCLPSDVDEIVQSYRHFHKESEGWRVTLWNEETATEVVDHLGDTFPSLKETYAKAESPAEKADIARCALLYEEGGFYADADLLCAGTLQELHHFSNFYCAIENLFFPEIQCCNAAIGSCPGHALMRDMLCHMRPKRQEEDRSSVLFRTGPHLFSRLIREHLKDEKNLLVLPPSYFYPMPYSRSSSDYGRVSLQQAKSWLMPWSKGVHMWNGSW